MHDSVMAWVKRRVDHYALADAQAVLEIGSLDVNGSVRSYFTGSYLGIDTRPGPGVDVVASGHGIPVASGSVDVVICTEVLEHDPAFWLTLGEIARILRIDGHLLLTTRGNGFGEHREPLDLWRFMPDAMTRIIELAECEPLAMESDPEVPGIFVHGRRS